MTAESKSGKTQSVVSQVNKELVARARESGGTAVHTLASTSVETPVGQRTVAQVNQELEGLPGTPAHKLHIPKDSRK